jgi:hypothetical protein
MFPHPPFLPNGTQAAILQQLDTTGANERLSN